MGRAEEEANRRYCIIRGDDTEETSGIDMQRALDFIDGYHQAEKDLELTWKDISEIVKIVNLLETEWLNSTPCDGIRDWGFYQEVLKRFKESKNKINKNE